MITKALADPTRLRLLLVLSQAHLTLAQTGQLLGQSGPRVSRHLRILSEASLVERSKEGKEAYFRLTNNTQIRPLINPILEALISEDQFGDLDNLKKKITAEHSRTQALEAKFYAKWNQARSFFVDEQQPEARLVEIAGKIASPTLLDIGTGTGRLLSALSSHVTSGLGIDTDKDMLSIARHRLAAENLSHISVKMGNMYNLDVSGRQFDLVCLYGVLKYANMPEAVLKEAASNISPGGTIVIVDFLEHDNSDLSDSYGHKWLGFDPNDITRWCQNAGINICEHETFTGRHLSTGLWQGMKP